MISSERRWHGGRVWLWLAGVAMAVGGLAWPASSLADEGAADEASTPGVAELAGIVAAERRLGEAAPTGAGIVLGHVEGKQGQYLPNVDHARYRDVTFHARSGESRLFSHAEATVRLIVGRQGLAPGMREAHHFTSEHWLTGGYLRAGHIQSPAEDAPRVFNHSWIADAGRGNEVYTNHVLRRVDFAIEHHGVLMCVGVNNSRNTRVPAMLGSAYNVMAVGIASGASSGGGTHFEGVDRSKPDIAAPGPNTSSSTPVVTAVVARMLEAGGRIESEDGAATRPEMIKAMLMAGATKPWNWRLRDGRPLDNHLGAGVVHLDNALRILESGRTSPNEARSGSGWDLREMKPGDRAIYRLDTEEPIEELSIMLVWNRRVDGRSVIDREARRGAWVDTPRLARFDLRVVHVDLAGNTQLLADSLSDIDNVQHVYKRDAPAGDYHLVVTRRDDGLDESWPVAIAWRAGEHVPYLGDD